MNKKICFISQFPPPIHGLSKAVDTLYNSSLQKEYEFLKIDITNNKKIIINLLKLITDNSSLYYFTISQSKGGNLRDLIIIKLLQLKKKRILVHLHGGYFRTLIDEKCNKLQKDINYKLFKNVVGGIVLGNSLQYIFNGILPNKKIFTVHNCVDNNFFISDITFKNKLSKINDKKVLNVLYLSNFIEEKGYKDILNIAKLIKEIGDNKFKFIFAGKFFDTDDKKYFYDFISNNKLEDIVEYIGIVSGKKKLHLLEDSDIFVLLTRYPNEGQPISIIEAMANGLSVITTNHAGIPDLVKDQLNGFIVKYNDYTNIIKKLLHIFNNRSVQLDMVKVNRKTVKQYFTESYYIENMKKVFKEVLL